ncbi:MAG TPA: hypothetical protein DEO98_04820, partial [Legionellales bacterium]|nr:hypothetical protein [Legionellales bacterium]
MLSHLKLKPISLLIRQSTHHFKVNFWHTMICQMTIPIVSASFFLSLQLHAEPTPASFPTAGDSTLYDAATYPDGAIINGVTTNNLNLNNQSASMTIDNILLDISNFNASTIRTSGSTLNIVTNNNGKVSFNNNVTNAQSVIFNTNISSIKIGDNTDFISNTLSGTDGMINNQRSSLSIGNNVNFKSNKNDNNGAAIYNVSGANLGIGDNASFNENEGRNIIYNTAQGEITIGSQASFTRNIGSIIYSGSSATTTIGNNTSFIENSSTAGTINYIFSAELTFLLDNDTTTLFRGNTDQSGNNSIAFGPNGVKLILNTGNSGESTTALLDMRDPMRVSYAQTSSGNIDINKNDDGVWALGGTNDFSLGAVQLNIRHGKLYLYGENEISNATLVDPNNMVQAGVLNLQGSYLNTTSQFFLDENNSLIAGGTNTINLGAGNIVIGDNATIRGGSQSRSLGGSTPRNELGGNTSLTLTSDNNTQLQGLVNLQALEARDAFTLNA